MNYILILIILGLTIFLIWKIPYWNLKSDKNELTKNDFLHLVNENRRTVAQILGGIYVLIGLGFSWNQIISTKESLMLSEKRFIRESFTDAIQQIGSKESQIRLGGIYSLRNLTEESTGYADAVIQVLSTYIRRNNNDSINGFLNEEIQAAIDVITKNELILYKTASLVRLDDIMFVKYNFNNSELSDSKLYNSKFIESQFIEANFERAKAYTTFFANCNFHHANLTNADFEGVTFNKSLLINANLTNVFASKSSFKEVNMENANLSGADFSESKFYNVNFHGAILNNTNLCGANLERVQGLSLEQIRCAKIDSRTILPNLK